MESHAEFLRRVTLDEELSRALLTDFRTAPLSDVDRTMLEYVVKITRAPLTISPSDHDRLGAAGFSDQGITQITLIAAWFNYINRVADALGVGRDDPAGTRAPVAEAVQG
jgi:uncharacterized peroxidase-related enzyme